MLVWLFRNMLVWLLICRWQDTFIFTITRLLLKAVAVMHHAAVFTLKSSTPPRTENCRLRVVVLEMINWPTQSLKFRTCQFWASERGFAIKGLFCDSAMADWMILLGRVPRRLVPKIAVSASLPLKRLIGRLNRQSSAHVNFERLSREFGESNCN